MCQILRYASKIVRVIIPAGLAAVITSPAAASNGISYNIILDYTHVYGGFSDNAESYINIGLTKTMMALASTAWNSKQRGVVAVFVPLSGGVRCTTSREGIYLTKLCFYVTSNSLNGWHITSNLFVITSAPGHSDPYQESFEFEFTAGTNGCTAKLVKPSGEATCNVH